MSDLIERGREPGVGELFDGLLVGPDTPPRGTSIAHRAAPPRRRRWLYVLGGFLVAVLAVGATGAVAVRQVVSGYDHNIQRFGDPFAAIPRTDRATADAAATGAMNMLLLGSDSRIDAGNPQQWSYGAPAHRRDHGRARAGRPEGRLRRLDPARQLGDDPGPRQGEDQRRVQLGRAESDGPHRRERDRRPHRPRRRRRLHRLQDPHRPARRRRHHHPAGHPRRAAHLDRRRAPHGRRARRWTTCGSGTTSRAATSTGCGASRTGSGPCMRKLGSTGTLRTRSRSTRSCTTLSKSVATDSGFDMDKIGALATSLAGLGQGDLRFFTVPTTAPAGAPTTPSRSCCWTRKSGPAVAVGAQGRDAGLAAGQPPRAAAPRRPLTLRRRLGRRPEGRRP